MRKCVEKRTSGLGASLVRKGAQVPWRQKTASVSRRSIGCSRACLLWLDGAEWKTSCGCSRSSRGLACWTWANPAIWADVPVPLEITILNLPGAIPSSGLHHMSAGGISIHTFHYVEGDACDVHQYPDRSSSTSCSATASSNTSVLRRSRRRSPAKQSALGKSYWVQNAFALVPDRSTFRPAFLLVLPWNSSAAGCCGGHRRTFDPGGRSTSREPAFSRAAGWPSCSPTPGYTSSSSLGPRNPT